MLCSADININNTLLIVNEQSTNQWHKIYTVETQDYKIFPTISKVWELTCCTHLGFLLAEFHLHHQAPPCFGGLRLDSKTETNFISKSLTTKKSYTKHIPKTGKKSCREHVPYCFLCHSMEHSYSNRSPLEWRLNKAYDTWRARCRANLSGIWIAMHIVKYGSPSNFYGTILVYAYKIVKTEVQSVSCLRYELLLPKHKPDVLPLSQICLVLITATNNS
jgi:hypothetical protein